MAGIIAILAGLYFGAYQPAILYANGLPLTAALLIAVTLPFVAFLVMLALFPEVLARPLQRFTRVDLRDGGHAGALILIAATLFFVLGYGSLVDGAFAYESQVLRGKEPEPLSGDAIFQGLILNIIVLVLPPFFYVAFVNGGGPAGALRALGIKAEGASRALAVGAMSAFGVLVLIAVGSYAVQGLNVSIPENQRALEIAKGVTVLGALGLAIGSAVSEEIFFRGFLQPRVGYLGQAALFALAHLSYLNVLEIVVVFTLALVFGAIYKRTGNLLAPIAGHFTFNLLMLLAGMYAPSPT